MNDDLFEVFVTEGRELLDEAVQALAVLRAGRDPAALERLFRAFHTLKGSAGLMAFAPMSDVFHAAEDRLSTAREGDGRLDRALVEALLAIVDQTEEWLDQTLASGRLPEVAGGLAQGLSGRLGAGPSKAEPPNATPPPALLRDLPPGRYVWARYTPSPDVYLRGDDPLGLVSAIPDLARLDLSARTPFGDLSLYDPFACNLVLEALSRAPEAEVRESLRLAAGAVEVSAVEIEAPERTLQSATSGRTLRVEAARIDDLASAADELVVLKNRLKDLIAETARSLGPALGRDLAKVQAELDRQALRMHAAVTRLRVTPLHPLFRRFPRLVRETSAALGREVELSLSGGDVEVDKAIVDGLFEPLLHLVRNALDHGVEPAAARRLAGKALPARVSLTAVASGEQVIIEVADDGRGIDPATVARAALERGLLGAETLAGMDDEAVVNLIFAPGFSTAGAVGDLSGRGVGLDAVRTAVTALGGHVSVRSELGRGARFVIALPLTVRLARLMTVQAGNETFAIPFESIVETTRLTSDRLTPVRAGRAFIWRDQPAPLLDLAQLLSLPGSAFGDEMKVVIVRAGGEVAGVLVDAFGEPIEAPLRPMTGLLAGAPGIAGASLTGDGRVLMVLDLSELIG